jgi:hypothetical protein
MLLQPVSVHGLFCGIRDVTQNSNYVSQKDLLILTDIHGVIIPEAWNPQQHCCGYTKS